MVSANHHRLFAQAATLVAACICLLGVAQVQRPLHAISAACSTAIAVQHQQLTRHALQEVSRRSTHPQAPSATGLLTDAGTSRRFVRLRMTLFAALWPMENWPARPRASCEDRDDPA